MSGNNIDKDFQSNDSFKRTLHRQEDRWNAYQARATNSLDGYVRARKVKEEEIKDTFRKIIQNPRPYYEEAVAKQRGNNTNTSQQQQQQQHQTQRQQR